MYEEISKKILSDTIKAIIYASAITIKQKILSALGRRLPAKAYMPHLLYCIHTPNNASYIHRNQTEIVSYDELKAKLLNTVGHTKRQRPSEIQYLMKPCYQLGNLQRSHVGEIIKNSY